MPKNGIQTSNAMAGNSDKLEANKTVVDNRLPARGEMTTGITTFNPVAG